MAAVLVAVVGPSGAGKDSLLAALKARAPGVHVVQRHITRPAEAGGEPHVPQTHESFAACLAAGGYALHWQAHGMCYGIPSEIDALLAKGVTVVFNGSRAMLAEAGAKYPQLLVAEIVVDRPILAARLAARGREDATEIAARLARASLPLPDGIKPVKIDNSGSLEAATHALMAVIAAHTPAAPALKKADDTMRESVFANATLVLPNEVIRGSLVVRAGKIAQIESGTSVPQGALDLEGDLLIPGLVELHTDNLERHIEPRPKVDWPHAAAILAHDGELASVGITTVFDAMRVGSIPRGDAGYHRYARALSREVMALREKGALRISHFLHLRAEVCSETLEEELAEFGVEDRVGLVSLMDHTPGQRQFRDLEKLRDYVQHKRGLSDAQFIEHVDTLRQLRQENGTRHEAATVAEAARLGAVLASHDDTTPKHVRISASYGVKVAEFPTTFEAAQACRDVGIAVMMGGPNLIRGGSHSGNVAAHALAEAGLLDIISSDYVPASLISSAFLLADLWGDLPRAIATVSATPAAAAGLADRGHLQVGLHADLVRVRRLDGHPCIRGVWSHGQQVG